VIVHEVVPAALAGERIDRVIAMITGRSRAEVAGLVTAGAVRVDGRAATIRSAKVIEGQQIEVDLPDLPAAETFDADPSVEVPIVHEDEHLVVVDKPAGLVVHPGAGHASGTLVHGLLARYPELAGVGEPHRPGIVHRLDKGTSGLMVVARSPESYDRLVADLAARRVERRYRTLVWGEVASPRGLIDAPVGRSGREPSKMAVTERGKEARTRYEVIAVHRRPVVVTELDCALETGRTHQIRVHLRSIGHSVVGDLGYGGARQSLPLDRPFLHAAELGLRHPVTGDPMRWISPLPADLRAVLDQLD
jgi:23S rRNA pseudouridine1911/1915/1917 synthase